jgi:hypothetical protein
VQVQGEGQQVRNCGCVYCVCVCMWFSCRSGGVLTVWFARKVRILRVWLLCTLSDVLPW